jgi:hypothetical protein
MRVRKPCVRARLTLEGWYVRFMMGPTSYKKLPLQILAIRDPRGCTTQATLQVSEFRKAWTDACKQAPTRLENPQ